LEAHLSELEHLDVHGPLLQLRNFILLFLFLLVERRVLPVQGDLRVPERALLVAQLADTRAEARKCRVREDEGGGQVGREAALGGQVLDLVEREQKNTALRSK
jgi:hypothetical protein